MDLKMLEPLGFSRRPGYVLPPGSRCPRVHPGTPGMPEPWGTPGDPGWPWSLQDVEVTGYTVRGDRCDRSRQWSIGMLFRYLSIWLDGVTHAPLAVYKRELADVISLMAQLTDAISLIRRKLYPPVRLNHRYG